MRDIDVRRALCSKLRRDHSAEPDCVWVEELELCLGIARIDLAVVNGTIHGYEIKSERDTLNRLPSQARIYSDALEFMTIIAAQNHVSKIHDCIPAWWSIWVAVKDGEHVRFEEERTGGRNPNLMSYALAQYLWRDEALQALEQRQEARGMRNKPRRVLWNRLAEVYGTEELADVVRKSLKSRPASWKVDSPSR